MQMNPRNATGAGRTTAARAVMLALLVLSSVPAAAAGQEPVAPTAPPAPIVPAPPPAAIVPAAPPAAIVPAAATSAAPARVVPAVVEVREGAPSGVTPASCTSCGTPGGGPAYGPGVFGWGHKYGPLPCDVGCGEEGCGEAGCHAGYPPCDACEGQSRLTRLLCAFHNAICCPDPCYEPGWVAAANAALFTPAVRPATYTRLRWD